MAEHFLGGREFDSRLLLCALLLDGLFALVLVESGCVALHGNRGVDGGGLGALVENGGKGFACAMEFAADSIAGLAGQFADFVIAELLVSH